MRGLPEVSRVVAIDERLGQLPDFAHLLDSGDGYTSLAAALPHVDAIVIATPPTTHLALAMQAVDAGKHVLVEKPLATRACDARDLIDAAEAAGVVLMTGHTFEYNAAVTALRDLISSGELGDLYYLDSARLNLGLYQTDVNVVLDLAPHDISIANYVLGAQPTAVTAWGSRHVHPDFEDVAYLRLEYGTLGVRANVHVSWLDPHKVRRTTAVGSKKMAVYNDIAEERIRVHDKAALPPDADRARVAYQFGDIRSPHVAFDEPLMLQDRHFATCIRDGLTPRSDGYSGLAVVAALEAAQISMSEGRTVLIEEVTGSELSTALSAMPTLDLRVKDALIPARDRLASATPGLAVSTAPVAL
jgi:predicted dehydrogenase